ncbi:MAG: 4Fe-4S dicluster domain-containing protein [Alphaproteobacteria bacterium]|nr:4Fe-4S dicluster domain-containing protein [Alphaproteobacteria bacterium]MDP6516998.1 4Fe-4S dicluster domain-containing protein [Alphaproteobacteria bacterium]
MTTDSVDTVDRERRRALALIAASVSVALAPGVFLVSAGAARSRPPGMPATAENRWGLLIDVGDCPDRCRACVEACRDENGWGGADGDTAASGWIRAVRVSDTATGAATTVPVMCQHCETPPCVDVCPTSASFRRADGIVLVDKHRCIGCRYCMMACPFGARSFVGENVSNQKAHAPRGKGTVESCTLCVHRVDTGNQPACVVACSLAGNRTMLFGDLNDPESDISQAVTRHLARRIRPDLALGQSVLYTGF